MPLLFAPSVLPRRHGVFAKRRLHESSDGSRHRMGTGSVSVWQCLATRAKRRSQKIRAPGTGQETIRPSSMPTWTNDAPRRSSRCLMIRMSGISWLLDSSWPLGNEDRGCR